MTTYASLRRRVREGTPHFLLPLLASVENYVRRLIVWAMVLRDIKGVSARDRAIYWWSVFIAPFTSLSELRHWREPKLFADANVVARNLGVFCVRPSSDDLGHILEAPNNKALFDSLRKAVKPGDVVLDAGANIGAMTVMLARIVGPTGKVIAVEMMPDTAERLRLNLVLNELNNVEIIKKALAAESGRETIANVTPGLFGQASIARGGGRETAVTVTVTTTTIDEVLADMPRVALMKMDLEGAEWEALKGAKRSLCRIQTIVFESSERETDAELALAACGFKMSRIDGRNLIARRPPTFQA